MVLAKPNWQVYFPFDRCCLSARGLPETWTSLWTSEKPCHFWSETRGLDSCPFTSPIFLTSTGTPVSLLKSVLKPASVLALERDVHAVLNPISKVGLPVRNGGFSSVASWCTISCKKSCAWNQGSLPSAKFASQFALGQRMHPISCPSEGMNK